MNYTPVIGLEVHIELKTKSKMFCGCNAGYFGQKPNTHTCPICLGLPGALPVPNRKAVEWCVMIGMALNCKISLVSKFDRKNYFYPDLAKGYQISQYDQPFCENGWIGIPSSTVIPAKAGIQKMDPRIKPEDDNIKVIRIRRVHMEEDTGKLLHETINGEKVTLIDFNRSGVPLVEIVTEPDFTSAEEVSIYLKKLQQIVRYLDVSSADMEKGEMRLEPNISLRICNTTNNPIKNEDLPKYKVEVKNINSFSFVEDAIGYEIKRQTEILDKGETPKQETRGWNEDKNQSLSQRSKEDAKDYRYFPEPDIPPIRWEESQISNLKSKMPELPDIKLARFVKEYGLSIYNAEILTRERSLADYFEEAVSCCHPELVSGSSQDEKKMLKRVQHDISSTLIANWIINKKINPEEIVPAELIMQIVKSQQISGISTVELEKILKAIINKNEKVVADYKSGKENALMFLVGQAMKELKGKAKAEEIKEKFQKLL